MARSPSFGELNRNAYGQVVEFRPVNISQPTQVPTEVSPPVPVAAGLGINPLLLGPAALAAGIGLYFAVRNNNGGTSDSPA